MGDGADDAIDRALDEWLDPEMLDDEDFGYWESSPPIRRIEPSLMIYDQRPDALSVLREIQNEAGIFDACTNI